MLQTKEEKATCEKYRKYDTETGRVGCRACPLAVDIPAMMCRANSSWDNEAGEWVADDREG